MKNKVDIEISAGALLMLSTLFFFCEREMFTAIVLSCAVHEAGHLIALRITGGRVTAFRATAAGFVIDCSGPYGVLAEVATIVAGPLAGCLFAIGAALAGERLENDFLHCAGGVSAMLTVFNLLPALPLDGGRVVEALAGAKAAAELGLAASFGLTVLGLLLIREGLGWAVFIAGAALILSQTRL